MQQLFFAVLLCIAVSGFQEGQKNHTVQKFSKNKVVAHRGAFKMNHLPENSIASLKQAIALGCEGSEFDVQRTADDSLIINHDPKFFGVDIETSTYSTLSATKLSNGELLPTLQQYLEEGMKQKRTKLVLEIKPSSVSKERGAETAVKVVELVRRLKASPWIIYISFDYDILKKIISIEPHASTQYLAGDKPPAQLKADGISGADYNFSVFKSKPGWIEEAKQHHIVLNAWTVNNQDDMDWLLARGFNLITTNEPELLLERVKSR